MQNEKHKKMQKINFKIQKQPSKAASMVFKRNFAGRQCLRKVRRTEFASLLTQTLQLLQ